MVKIILDERKEIRESDEMTLRLLSALEAAEAEQDWLAKQLYRIATKHNAICPRGMKCPPVYDCIHCWKEAAHKAVTPDSPPLELLNI